MTPLTPRQTPTSTDAGPQITTCWHAAGIENATSYALNVYLGLAFVALLVLVLWLAYLRATNGD